MYIVPFPQPGQFCLLWNCVWFVCIVYCAWVLQYDCVFRIWWTGGSPSHGRWGIWERNMTNGSTSLSIGPFVSLSLTSSKPTPRPHGTNTQANSPSNTIRFGFTFILLKFAFRLKILEILNIQFRFSFKEPKIISCD